jgi:hypothetical protein
LLAGKQKNNKSQVNGNSHGGAAINKEKGHV